MNVFRSGDISCFLIGWARQYILCMSYSKQRWSTKCFLFLILCDHMTFGFLEYIKTILNFHLFHSCCFSFHWSLSWLVSEKTISSCVWKPVISSGSYTQIRQQHHGSFVNTAWYISSNDAQKWLRFPAHFSSSLGKKEKKRRRKKHSLLLSLALLLLISGAAIPED